MLLIAQISPNPGSWRTRCWQPQSAFIVTSREVRGHASRVSTVPTCPLKTRSATRLARLSVLMKSQFSEHLPISEPLTCVSAGSNWLERNFWSTVRQYWSTGGGGGSIDPRWDNIDPRWDNIDPRWGNIDPRWDNIDPRWDNSNPRWHPWPIFASRWTAKGHRWSNLQRWTVVHPQWTLVMNFSERLSTSGEWINSRLGFILCLYARVCWAELSLRIMLPVLSIHDSQAHSFQLNSRRSFHSFLPSYAEIGIAHHLN